MGIEPIYDAHETPICAPADSPAVKNPAKVRIVNRRGGHFFPITKLLVGGSQTYNNARKKKDGKGMNPYRPPKETDHTKGEKALGCVVGHEIESKIVS